MGPNPSFFRFVKHLKIESSKMSYTEHLLSSLRFLKINRYSSIMVVEKIEGSGLRF